MTDGIVNIHGKQYQTVAYRVSNFREKHPDWGIITDIVEANDETVVMRCVIYDAEQNAIGTGHAEEKRGSTQINRTSALENCETSAIGRALAAIGMGGTEYASANEVQNAVQQQNEPEPVPFPKGHYSGKSSLKQAFRTAVTAIRNAADLDELNKVYTAAVERIKPQALDYPPMAEWWTGVDDDPERLGVVGQYKIRYEELTNSADALATEIGGIENKEDLGEWEMSNLARLDELPDEDRQKIEGILSAAKKAFKLTDTVGAG